MKKLAATGFALVLLVLFPGLAHAVLAPVAEVVVWASAQPVLVGAVLGAMAWPQIRRAKPKLARTH